MSAAAVLSSSKVVTSFCFRHQRSAAPSYSARLFFSSSPDYATSYETWHNNRLTDYYQSEQRRQHRLVNGDGTHCNRGSANSTSSHAVINLDNHSNDNAHHSHYVSNSPLEGPRTSVLMELSDRVGALHDVLKYLCVQYFSLSLSLSLGLFHFSSFF